MHLSSKGQLCYHFAMTQALSITSLFLTLDHHEIFSDITFSLEKGSLTLLCGRNGSGKSMLLRTIKGLISASKGSIGIGLEEKTKKSQRMAKTALVFQDADVQIVGSTVKKDIEFGLENLSFSPAQIKEKTDSALTSFDLIDHAKQNPATLSGGEKRRLAIADVIVMDPEIILMDEPLANLDYPSTMLVLETIQKLKAEGRTILLVSHEAEKLLALTDRVIIMEDGKIMHDGASPSSLEAMREHHIYVPGIPFEEITWLKV